MAKLYQHQADETYYTRTYEGGIVTRQIHPDGVAYLKYCGVGIGRDIPPGCLSELRAYGWLFTKDEVPFWGQVDWSPRWVVIQPRPLDQLTPFSGARSVSEWVDGGVAGTRRSVADDVQSDILAARERKVLEREKRLAEMRAETEARLQRIRAEGRAKIEAARKAREQEEAARPDRERQVEEERSGKRRAAALKGAETRRQNREARQTEVAAAMTTGAQRGKPTSASQENSSPSPVVVGLANRIGPLGTPPQQTMPPPLTSRGRDQEEARVTATPAASHPDRIDDPRHTKRLVADGESTAPSRWWMFFILAIIMAFIIGVWLKESSLVGVFVAMLVLVVSVRLLRNARLDALHVD